MLGSRQMAILHAAPLSATVPPIGAPRAETNPSAPGYQQHGGPLGGPIMQAARGHAVGAQRLARLPATTRPPEQHQPGRSAMPAPATAHFESNFSSQRVMPATVMPRAPALQSGSTMGSGTPSRARPTEEFERQNERASRSEQRQPFPQHAVMAAVPAPQSQSQNQSQYQSQQQLATRAGPPGHAMPEARPTQPQQVPQSSRGQSSSETHRAVEGPQAHHNSNEREGSGRPQNLHQTR